MQTHLLAFFLSFRILSASANPFIEQVQSPDGRKTCTVTSLGDKKDDAPNILAATTACANGTIIFPSNQSYWISSRLHLSVSNTEFDWQGQWTFSDNLTYWRSNSYIIPFQNHRAAFILSGSNISINGHQHPWTSLTPNIHGNGDPWYTAEAGNTIEGRPMPFVLWNVTNVSVTNFHIKDPPLWGFNVMNGTNISVRNLKVNATSTKAPYGKNSVQNTDGFDTMDCTNVTLENFWYQGGDDCIAVKPRSYGIAVRNVTCHGGNGIASGSLGQYLEDSSVQDVVIDDVDIVRYNEDMHNCAYVKTWMGGLVPQSGYESAGQQRGGGWGTVSNITFKNFRVEGADGAPYINQDSGNNGSYGGTSKMLVHDVNFVNFTGWLNGKTGLGTVSCSKANPCYGITFRDMHLRSTQNGTVENKSGTCKYIEPSGVKGLEGGGC
jgi:polygalacturonase